MVGRRRQLNFASQLRNLRILINACLYVCDCPTILVVIMNQNIYEVATLYDHTRMRVCLCYCCTSLRPCTFTFKLVRGTKCKLHKLCSKDGGKYPRPRKIYCKFPALSRTIHCSGGLGFRGFWLITASVVCRERLFII